MDVGDQWLSWVITIIGLIGFYLAGKKVWWCWYVNIANQFLWAAYALIFEQWGFLLGVLFYAGIFTKNAYEWTRERPRTDRPPENFGRIDSVNSDENGVTVNGTLTPEGAAYLKKHDMVALSFGPLTKNHEGLWKYGRD